MKKIPNNFIWEHKQLLLILFFFFFADMTDIALKLEKTGPTFQLSISVYPCHPSQHADRRQETSSLFDSSCKHFKAF